MNTEKLLDDIKSMLEFDLSDTDSDEKLVWMLQTAKARLQLLLGGLEPPEELAYIVVEVTIIRFNRIGSEGLSSHSVEGESLSFNDNDFAGYMDDIEAYLDSQKAVKKGRVRFL